MSPNNIQKEFNKSGYEPKKYLKNQPEVIISLNNTQEVSLQAQRILICTSQQ